MNSKVIYKGKILDVPFNFTSKDLEEAFLKNLNNSITNGEKSLYLEYTKTNNPFEFNIEFKIEESPNSLFEYMDKIKHRIYDQTSLKYLILEEGGDIIKRQLTFDEFSEFIYYYDEFSQGKKDTWVNKKLNILSNEMFKIIFYKNNESMYLVLKVSHLIFDGPSILLFQNLLNNKESFNRKKPSLEGDLSQFIEHYEEDLKFIVKNEKRKVVKESFDLFSKNLKLSEFIAIYSKSVYQLSNQRKFCIGIPFDCRKQTNDVGYFTRIIPLYFELNEKESIKDISNRLDIILDKLYKNRFDVTIYPKEYDVTIGKQRNVFTDGVKDIGTDIDVGTILTFDLLSSKLGDKCELFYDSGKISQTFIKVLISSIQNKNDNTETSTLIGKQKEIPSSLLSLVEDTIKNNKEKNFAMKGIQKYSFKYLDEKARDIEKLLIKNGLTNSRICVVSGRNIMLYASVIAILRTNNSYIPLSKENSCKRIEELSIEAESSAILYLDEDDYKIKIIENKFLKKDDEIYVMFSSGTTGKPKGIIIDEPGLINNLDWGIDEFKINKNTIILFKEKIIFDISIWEIFFPLVSGCQVVIFPDNDERYIEKIKQTIQQFKINWTYCMFSQGMQLLDVIDNYEGQFLFGAESFNPSLLGKLKRFTNAEFYNTYGPTETTITCTSYHIDTQKNSVPIGGPIQNTSIYLLDENQNIVAPGVKGEICIGGLGVGLGYINNSEKNESQYIKSDSNEPIYRSGDYGYISNEGIEFLGRDINDSQKKFKGYRIDLKEIEGAINELPNVSLAIVQIYEERQLLASIKLNMDTEENEEIWKEKLSNKLPYYMIPDYFETMKEFPLMQNGKVDKNQLLAKHNFVLHKKNQNDKLEYPINTKIEKDVAKIWEEILHSQSSIDNRNANFFNLGGSSLDVPKVTYQISKRFGIEIESFQVYKYPTIELFSKYISSYSNKDKSNSYDLDYNLLLSQIKELCNEK